MPLQLQPNLSEPGQRYFRDFTPGDDFYEALIDGHRELSDEQSQLLNAQRILLLADQVGDIATLKQALILAHEGI